MNIFDKLILSLLVNMPPQHINSYGFNIFSIKVILITLIHILIVFCRTVTTTMHHVGAKWLFSDNENKACL